MPVVGVLYTNMLLTSSVVYTCYHFAEETSCSAVQLPIANTVVVELTPSSYTMRMFDSVS